MYIHEWITNIYKKITFIFNLNGTLYYFWILQERLGVDSHDNNASVNDAFLAAILFNFHSNFKGVDKLIALGMTARSFVAANRLAANLQNF